MPARHSALCSLLAPPLWLGKECRCSTDLASLVRWIWIPFAREGEQGAGGMNASSRGMWLAVCVWAAQTSKTRNQSNCDSHNRTH